MAGRRMYSEAEFSVAVKEAVAEKKAAQDELMAPIRMELDRMTDAIDSANHLKSTLGDKLDEVQRLQGETNTKLQHHIDTTHQLRREFGVDAMSLEQKKALSGVLAAAVQDGQGSVRRAAWIGFATQVVSAIAGAVVAIAAVLALVASGTIQIGVSHHP